MYRPVLFFSFLRSQSLFSVDLFVTPPPINISFHSLCHVQIHLTLQFSQTSVSLQIRFSYFIFLPAVFFLVFTARHNFSLSLSLSLQFSRLAVLVPFFLHEKILFLKNSVDFTEHYSKITRTIET